MPGQPRQNRHKRTHVSTRIIAGLLFLAATPATAFAASLSVIPSAGTFQVGSTFSISILLDTEGDSVNAIQAELEFPPDKLQIVTPRAGESVISIWTDLPQFDNAKGSIVMQGAIPKGIVARDARVATLTFRARASGTAFIRFKDSSRVLKNDGLGTDILRTTTPGALLLTLPPPAGPIVASLSHPLQERWYNVSDVILQWAGDDTADAYSYVLNDIPVDTPDSVSEGTSRSVRYQGVADGTHYFHIKALRAGVWGGSTHFAVNVDTTPPAEFLVEVSPGPLTSSRDPVLLFSTTDSASGVDFYEVGFVAVSPCTSTTQQASAAVGQPFFVETQSPYIARELEPCVYDAMVNAYDLAGNTRVALVNLAVVHPFFDLVAGNFVLFGSMVVPAYIPTVILLGLLFIFGRHYYRSYRAHRDIHAKLLKREWPDALKEKLSDLKQYQEKYGEKAIHSLFLAFVVGSALFLGLNGVEAQTIAEVPPPQVTAFSRHVTNEELYYIGGKTEFPETIVTVFLQNETTREAYSSEVESDSDGRWFYRHPTPLPAGNYVMWVQATKDGLTSPPSPQIILEVERIALQWGTSRVSREALYSTAILVLIALSLYLFIAALIHRRHIRRKHEILTKEIHEAETAVQRGFALVKHDIEDEIAALERTETHASSEELSKKKQELFSHLEHVRTMIGREVHDIERAEKRFSA